MIDKPEKDPDSRTDSLAVRKDAVAYGNDEGPLGRGRHERALVPQPSVEEPVEVRQEPARPIPKGLWNGRGKLELQRDIVRFIVVGHLMRLCVGSRPQSRFSSSPKFRCPVNGTLAD